MNAEKIKSVLDVRDLRLLVRKCQATLGQKPLDKGLDLLLQANLGAAGDDEI